MECEGASPGGQTHEPPFVTERESLSLNIQSCINKGSFYSKSALLWSNFQISKKYIPDHYPEHKIQISCLLFLAGNLNFKVRRVIWNNFFLKF